MAVLEFMNPVAMEDNTVDIVVVARWNKTEFQSFLGSRTVTHVLFFSSCWRDNSVIVRSMKMACIKDATGRRMSGGVHRCRSA